MDFETVASYLPHIAEQVYRRPWMMMPSVLTGIFIPRLESAVAQPDRHEAVARRLSLAERKESAVAAVTGRAEKRGEWMVNGGNARAAIPYNMDSATKVGQVYVTGAIGKGLSGMDMSCGGVCVDHIKAALGHLEELGAQAAGIYFNSPGGTVTGVPELAAWMKRLDARMPLHAYTDSMCASAAYYLAASCRSFCASPTAAVGSIGVYCAVTDRSGEWEKAGRKTHLLASGKFKGQGYPGVPVADEFLERLRGEVMGLAHAFWAHVIACRGMQIQAEAAALGKEPAEWADEIMQGQDWMAQDAPECLLDGLCDDRAEHLGALCAALRR
jgi:ClpP class serine protease